MTKASETARRFKMQKRAILISQIRKRTYRRYITFFWFVNQFRSEVKSPISIYWMEFAFNWCKGLFVKPKQKHYLDFTSCMLRFWRQSWSAGIFSEWFYDTVVTSAPALGIGMLLGLMLLKSRVQKRFKREEPSVYYTGCATIVCLYTREELQPLLACRHCSGYPR